MGNQYTVEDADLFRSVVVAKWRWLRNNGRLDNQNEKGLLSIFDGCVKAAWILLTETDRPIPLNLLFGALRSVRWNEKQIDDLLTLREKEAVEALLP